MRQGIKAWCAMCMMLTPAMGMDIKKLFPLKEQRVGSAIIKVFAGQGQ